jgi:hypothetical protein
MAAWETDLKRWVEAHGDIMVWYRDQLQRQVQDRPG